MQKVVFVAILLLPLTVAAGEPMAVTEQCPASSPARFQLVGFTAATLPGNSGVFGFSVACQAEYPNSRFCAPLQISVLPFASRSALETKRE